MERKYLNEDNYNRGKAKLRVIALSILLIGVLIGGFLIYIGIDNNRKAVKNVEIQKEEDAKKLEKTRNEIALIDEKIKIVTSPFEKLKLKADKSKLENELNDLDNQIYHVERANSIPFYMFGGFIIIASSMFSLSIYMVTKRREIIAFSVQQAMPVAKEIVDEVSDIYIDTKKKVGPVEADYYGDVASKITKGIKDSLKDDK